MTSEIRLLYVDDEPSLLDIGKVFLEDSGEFKVTNALSAADALKLLEQENFDTIISDYQMPEMDGIQFLVEVRARFGQIPFILFTGRGREEIVIQAINSGADFYLQKGGDPGAQFAELSHKIKSAASRKKADDALRKSEEKYRHLIEHSDEVIVVAQDGMLKLVNQKAIELTGYSEQELLSMSFFSCIHPNDRAMVIERYQKRMKREEAPSRYAFRLSSKEGSIRWVELSVVLIDWEGRSATLNFLTDITERKLGEDALRKSENLYQTLSESSPDMIYLVDRDGIFQYINPRAAQAFLLTPADIIGKRTDTIFPPDIGRHHMNEINIVVTTKEPRFIETFEQFPTGARWFSTRLVPLTGPDREVIQILGISTDITERKRAETELQESSERYKSLITVSNTGAWEYNRDRDYLWFSPEYFLMLGRDTKEFDSSGAANLKETWIDLLHPDDRNRAIEHFTQYLESGSPGIYENHFRMQHAEGHWVWIWSRGWTLRDKNGALTNKTIGTHIDITESRRTQEAQRMNNEHLRLAQEIGQTGSWELDFATGMIWGSEEAFKIFAIPRPADGILSLDAVEARIPERERVRRALTDLIETGAEYNIEYAVEPDDNSGRKIVHSAARILTDAENKPVRIAGVTQDVTRLRKAETALLHQSKMLSILNDIITTANKADDLAQLLDSILTESLRLLDFDAGGIYIVDRTTRTANIVHSKNLPKEFLVEIQTAPIDKKPYDTLFIKNEPIITEDYAKIAPALSKKFGFQSVASILLLSKGVAIGALNIASMRRQVITEEEKQTLISISGELGSTIERMIAEEDAKNSSKNLETLFNSIDEMVFVLDMQGRILVVNNTVLKRLLYTSKELSGMDVLQLHVPELRDEALRNVQGMIAGTIDSCPVPVLAKDGTRIDVETKVTRGWWNGKEVLIGVTREITERKRAEEALRESEERYKNISETTSDFVFSCIKPDGGTYSIDWIAGAVEKITGYTIDELRAMGCWRCLVHPDDTPVFDENITNLPEGTSGTCILRIRTKSGAERWLAVNTTHVPGKASSSFCHVFGGCRDITGRKMAEEVLKQSEEKYRTLFEGALNPILIVDEEGRYVDANAAALEFLETEKEELIRKTVRDYSPQRLIEKQKHEHSPLTETRTLEIVYSVHGKEKTLILNVLPVEISGKHYIIGIGQDITERKRAEEALRKSEEKFRLITDTIDETFWMADVEIGKIFYVSPSFERIWGLSRESLYKNPRSFLDAIHNDDRERVLAALEIEKTGQPFDHEYRIVLPDGNIRNIWDRGFPVRDEKGQISIYAGIAIDITERKVAERALLESEEKYRVIFNNDIYAICIFDLDTQKLLDVNDAYEKLYGYTRNELLSGMTVHDITAEHEASDSATGEAINRGTIFIPLRYHKKKDGTIFPVEIVGGPYLLNGKKVMFVLTHDITERKMAEEKLAESEEKFRLMVENSHDIIYTLSTEGVFNFVSPAWTTLLGQPVTEVVGQPFQKFIHPDDLPGCMVFFHSAIRTGQRQEGIEYRVQHTNGNWYWHTSSAVPMKDKTGTIIGFHGIAHDITGRKVAEDALRESEERMRLLMNSTAEAIYGLDMNGNCTFCNNSCLRMLGYKSPDELLGRNMHWQIHAKYPDGTHFPVEDCRIFQAFNKGEETHVDDEVLWRSDGTSFPAEYWSYPQRHEGKVVGAVVTFLDITERKELEKEMEFHELELRKFSTSLATANKKLTLLSSITRHDINNQLTVLMGYLTILTKKQPDPALNDYFMKVTAAAQRISSMIQFTSEYEKIGINAPIWQDVRTLADTATKQAQLGKVVVKNDLPAGAEVFADPLVFKVFYNLMDNAVRYGGKITTIRFSAEEHDGDQIIVCEDDGIGVPVNEKERIFERGFGKNTGLGLYLSQDILSITGITIRETGEPGKGARFEMVVPKGCYRFTSV